jgi:sugar phosphate isomerase/epimerase
LPSINWVRLPSTAGESPTPVLSAAAALDTAVSAGFPAVGIDGFTASTVEPLRLAELFAGSGLRCSEVGVLAVAGSGNLTHCRHLAAMAKATGAKLCVTTSTIETGPILVRELIRCAEVLEDVGARIAIEFLPYSPLATLTDAIDICTQVGWERCGLLLDSWHFFRSGSPWDVLDQLTAEQIGLIQINDAPPPISPDVQFESRFRRVAPGNGMHDIARFVAAITATGFTGPISPEVLSATLIRLPPAAFATSLMESLRRCWPLPVN